MLDRHQSRGIDAGMSEWKIPSPPRTTKALQVVPGFAPCVEVSEEKEQEIADWMRAGKTVSEVCERVGLDTVTFYKLCDTVPSLSKKVSLARVSMAHALADRAIEIGLSAFDNPGMRGERAKGADVAVRALQWQAERRLPSVYGQRSAIAIDARVTHSHEQAISVADIADLPAVKKTTKRK